MVWLPLNYLMGTIWAWIPSPESVTREALGPTSRVTGPGARSDDPSQDNERPADMGTVPAL